MLVSEQLFIASCYDESDKGKTYLLDGHNSKINYKLYSNKLKVGTDKNIKRNKTL